jgi:sec-independent protein translocase protein TatA
MFRNPLIDAAVVLIVVLLFFGPKRLPLLGKSLGEGMREFKDSITGHSKDDDEERTEIGEGGPAATSASPPAATSAPPAEPASAPVDAPAPAPESAGVASSEPRS